MAPAPAGMLSKGLLTMLLLVVCATHGCAGPRFRGPARLALAGTAVVLGGSAIWIAGERASSPGDMPAVGLVTAAAGMAAVIAAGGWIALTAACESDPDCDESEECREIPAPPGGVPYKQCMPR